MVSAYTTAALVMAELSTSVAFGTGTVPTADQIATWIAEESDTIDQLSGRIYTNTAYTDTIDYQGEETIALSHAPVLTVTSVLYSTSALGTSTYALSDTKTADTDYTVYLDEGELVILPNWAPTDGRKRIQVNYTAGYSTTPLPIQKLATKKVAKRTVDTIMEKSVKEQTSGKSISVGSVSVVKAADFGVSQYTTLKSDINELENQLINGTSVYRLASHRY